MSKVGFSVRALLVTVAVVAIATYLTLNLVRRHKQDVIEEEIIGGLMQVATGLFAYVKNGSGVLPVPAYLDDSGTAMFSWRLKVLVLITSVPITKPPRRPDWQQPWNAPSNRWLADWPCWVYCSAYAPPSHARDTRIFAVSGKGTAFDPTGPVIANSVGNEVILLMEVANSGVNWMEPGDYEITELMQYRGRLRDCVAGNLKNRLHVLFADGEIWCLTGNTPMERLKPFLLLKEAPLHSREAELGPYRLRRWQSLALPGRQQTGRFSAKRDSKANESLKCRPGKK